MTADKKISIPDEACLEHRGGRVADMSLKVRHQDDP